MKDEAVGMALVAAGSVVVSRAAVAVARMPGGHLRDWSRVYAGAGLVAAGLVVRGPLGAVLGGVGAGTAAVSLWSRYGPRTAAGLPVLPVVP